MECKDCKTHTLYLERIINLQNDQIEYLKTLITTKTHFSQIKSKDKSIMYSVYDIVDHNFESLDLQLFINDIEETFPANEKMVDMIQNIIMFNDHVLFVKEKSNLIKFLSKNNNMEYIEIEKFSKNICEYVFNLIKPEILSKMQDKIEDLESQTENNMINNIMLLRDIKFQVKVTNLITRLNNAF